ncbi:MAG: DUF393 domain-containing protein [Sandaracinaceae bacterium]|nr:DUF393 domain-containing protein [Sandaracinaceae bacterium]
MLILYDGVCGLCNHFVQFIVKRDPLGIFKYASIQSDTGRKILTRRGRDPNVLDTVIVVLEYDTPSERILIKSRAGLFVLKSLGWPWKALNVVAFLPTAFLDFFYGLVANNRYKLFGKHDTCRIPTPAERKRFIDV